MGSRNTQIPHRSRGQLGSYDLLHTLGAGAFGKVYMGEHIHLHSRAAVKELHTALVNERAERFRYEAQIVAQLDPHPHIVRVLDYGIQDGRPYIVMDYAPHGNLRQRHTFGEKLPLPRVVSYVKQLASGLQHAHNSDLVHCDVKPENMFLGRQGKVLIGDFGIAVNLQEENTRSEDTFGTVPYMAPEQILGHPQPTSDQYALTVVVYEWLTGQLPFTGADKLEIANKHLHDQPPSMRAINPAIPVEVEPVVMKALNKDPEQRYPNISAFAQALEAASGPRRPAPAQQNAVAMRSAIRHPAHPPQRRVFRYSSLLLLIPLLLLGLLAVAFLLLSVATVTITETGLTQTWEDDIPATVDSNDFMQNPVAAHAETIQTMPQKNAVPTTGKQYVPAAQAYGVVTFYNSDIVSHPVPAGTIIAVPHSTLQVMTDEAVTVPAGNLSKAGQVSAQAHVVQADADGNIAAHALYGTTCCSSDTIRVDNLNGFRGGQGDQIYSIVQQSDIDGTANSLEAPQVHSAPNLLQKAEPSEVLVASSVQCTPTVSSDAAVGSRATIVTVTVISTCMGAFYNSEAVHSLAISRFIDYEDRGLGNAYVQAGSVKMSVTKADVLPAQKGLARLVLHTVATGVWHFYLNKTQKERLLRAIAGKRRGEAYAQLIRIIYKPGVNRVNIQFAWNIPEFADDRLPSDINRITLKIVQK